MTSLTTGHINSILKGNAMTKPYFIGTFPSCMIGPLPRRKEYCFITNTDNHESSGTHWNSWVVKDKIIYFFDSFGRSPLHAAFPHDYRDILLMFNNNFQYFDKQIQPIDSFTCGYYCIHFIMIFSIGLDLNNFSSEYSSDTNKNDIIVMNIIRSIV